MTRYVVPFVGGVAVTLAVLAWSGSSSSGSASASRSPDATAASSPLASRVDAPGVDRRALVREIRGVVRDELEQRQASALSAEPAPSPADAPADPRLDDPAFAERNAQAYESINQLIDAGLAEAHWGDRDADEFRAHMGSLTAEQADEALSRLILAINRDQLRVETSGMPF